MTWRRIATALGRIHTVTITATAIKVTGTTPLTENQQAIVDACAVAAPPRVTTFNPPEHTRQARGRHMDR